MKESEGLQTSCPNCGKASYNGGYCFECGTYRPSKRAAVLDSEQMDLVEYFAKNEGARIESLGPSDDEIEERERLTELRSSHKPKKQPLKWTSIQVIESPPAEILLNALVEPYQSTDEGQLIHAVHIPWAAIVSRLQNDWNEAFKIDPRMWEEIIAGAFDRAGYDRVTLTPRSGDFGRDVIAEKDGIGCIRIVGSVKAYKPGHLVTHDDVRALSGVVHGDPRASKGILSTTSDFAPHIKSDPLLSHLMPFRLELMNGLKLRQWLSDLSKAPRFV
jgi:restriction system protein